MRPFEEINQEYAQLCVSIGDLYAKKMSLESQLELLVARAQELEVEAAASKTEEATNSEVSEVSEGSDASE